MTKKPTQKALLAGGCYWGVEELFRELDGVINTEVGYTGGHTPNPRYEEVKTGSTGHAEALLIEFEPSRISFKNILEFFFTMHDPTTPNRQGNDVGSQYRSAIFCFDENQTKEAYEAINQVKAKGLWKTPICTQVVLAKEFYSAESYHQDYLQKNPGGYTCHWIRK